MQKKSPKKILKLSKIFTIFFKIGLFTFGGGFAMIPLMKKELVEKKGWIEEERFIDAISVTQSVPGAVAINLSIFFGYNLLGIPGAVVAAFAVALPSFLIILGIAVFFNNIAGNPLINNIFKGIRPAVVGMILYAGFELCKNVDWSLSLLLTLVLALLASSILNISPVIIIFMVMLITLFSHIYRQRKGKYKMNQDDKDFQEING